jgi:hypothetical protein
MAGGTRKMHDTGWDASVGQDAVGSWTQERPAGMERMTNGAPVPCPHGPGWAGQHVPHGFRPKPEKENNPLLTLIKTKQ